MNSTAKYTFTIIVPLYNEAEMIPSLFKRLGGYLESSPLNTCVLFVNDGSTDNTAKLLLDGCSSRKDCFYIELAKNSGLSAALKAGFDNCHSELCGYIDADLQTDPEDFNLLLEQMDGNLMVTGIRSQRDDSTSKRLQSKIANSFRRMMTGDKAEDTCCPLKIFRTEAARKIPLFKGMHRFFPALILLQEGGSFGQVPVSHHKRCTGRSKFSLFNRFPSSFVDCFAFRWMKSRNIIYKISSSKV